MSEEDRELEILKAKRLLEMQKNISKQQKQEELKLLEEKQKVGVPSPREIVAKNLGYRGLEVLQNAESQFPNETKLVVTKLAELIQTGEISEIIDGGKLLTLFRSVGIPVRVHTTINVEQDGKLVSWSDKLKERSKIVEKDKEQSTEENSP